MVQVPPLSEGAYSQVRAALAERAALLDAHIAQTTDAETLDYLYSAQFWTNDASLTLANAEEALDPMSLAKWEAERNERWTLP